MYAIGSNSTKRTRPPDRTAERRQAWGAQAQTRAILLAVDRGASDEEIASSIGVGGSTVYRTKRRFAARQRRAP